MPGLELVSFFESGFTGPVPDAFCEMQVATSPPTASIGNTTAAVIDSNEAGAAADDEEESESDDPPPPRPEQKVLVIGCNTTDLCNCCERRGTRIVPGEIHVECAEDLGLAVGF